MSDNYKELLINEFKQQYLDLTIKKCNINKDNALSAINENVENIYYIKEIDENIAIAALKQNGLFLPFLSKKVGKQTDAMVITAVKQNWQAIKFVIDQNEEACILALKQNWNAIRLIRKQTAKIMNELILANPLAYPYLDKPSKKIQIEAVRANPEAIQFIYDSTPCVESIMLAVRSNGLLLKHIYMKNQNKKINLEAVKNNPMALEYAAKQDESIILQAVTNDGMAMQFAHFQNEKIIKAAINNYAESYRLAVEDFGYAVDVLAVEKEPLNIIYVANQTCELAYRALSKNINVLPFINEDLFEGKTKKFLGLF